MDNTKLEKIGDELWKRTQRDWELRLQHSLTEPTCPTAIISCEDEGFMYWRADADTIDEAFDRVIDTCYAYLFEGGQSIGVPWSEPSLKKV